MADTKISALAALLGAGVAAGDLVPIVDVSDVSMAASGTDKNITADEFAIALSNRLFTFVRKTADEAVTSSNALQNDDELFAALAVNSTYIFECFAIYDGSTTGDIKLAFTIPAAAILNWAPFGLIVSVGGVAGSLNASVQTSSGVGVQNGAVGAGTKVAARMRGIVRTAGTAGTLQFQWAQGTADPIATNVFADSFLTVQKVA